MSQDGRDAQFIPSDYRANFKNVIAKRSDLVKFIGGRMASAGAGLTATYEAGLVVGKITSSGLYKAYNSANSDGSEVPVGVVSEQVITDEFGNSSEAVIIIGGILFKDMLIGYDANAKSVLGAKEYVEKGVNLVSF